MTGEEILKLNNEALTKAHEDPEFKKLLLSDGNKAVKELTGKDLPIKYIVHDSDEKHLVFVLPEVKSGELDESDLSGVSGGVKRVNNLSNYFSNMNNIGPMAMGYYCPSTFDMRGRGARLAVEPKEGLK